MLEPVGIDGSVANAWARLRVALRNAGLRMPVDDSWIAATAMALDASIVTRGVDFAVGPRYSVIRV